MIRPAIQGKVTRWLKEYYFHIPAGVRLQNTPRPAGIRTPTSSSSASIGPRAQQVLRSAGVTLYTITLTFSAQLETCSFDLKVLPH